MQKINVSLITIGDELLIGQVIDTNSAWMAQALNKIGLSVNRRVAVGDAWSAIWQGLDDELNQSDVVLITGGLGPTADDITKPLLCEYFGGNMIVDAGALANVEAIFKKLNRPMIPRNQKQAEVPDVCRVIQNKRGTAPGMIFEKPGKIVVSMPGVPHEMKGMMTDVVCPELQQRFTLPTIIHQTLLTAGVGESFLADLIQPWEEALPDFIKLAYLPNYGMVRLRLSATGYDKPVLEQQVNLEFDRLKQLVADHLVTDVDEPLQAVVLKLLQQRNATMCTAESCTGGYIAHLITSIAGSSNAFLGSVVSYSNGVKEKLLGVKPETLADHGAVSEAVVTEMVAGVLDKIGADFAIAVSGIMGPDGGSDEKPVGMVWMAAANGHKTITEKFHFRFDRGRNIELTATYALNLLRKLILETP